MYLKELEINGFKSFGKKSSLTFTSPISGIVGPNGSGKSNVAEAFRFVLGEQSIKNMRGKKGEDLIFTGSGSSLGRASVKVYFDNSDHVLAIDFKEVVIERAVLRDGTNEYLINGAKVRAKDISELLSGANIGSSGHHIISQGEADKILQLNPKERKSVIEEALGLKIYTLKKQEAERKLDKTAENLKEVRAQQKITAPRILYLKREVEQIEKNRQMKEELRALYSIYFPHKKSLVETLDTYKTKREELHSKIREKEQEIEVKRRELENTVSESGVREKAEEFEIKQQELNNVRREKEALDRELGGVIVRIEILQDEKQKKQEQESEGDMHIKHDEALLESISEYIHELWSTWAHTLMREENLSEDRKERWQKRFIQFKDLPEDEKEVDRQKSIRILSIIHKQVPKHEVKFDSALYERMITNKSELEHKREELERQEQELARLCDELDDGRDASQTMGQRVEIEILKTEKELADINGELQQVQMLFSEVERRIATYDYEEARARGHFGEEVTQFFNAELSAEQEMLNISEKITRLHVLLENGGGTSGSDMLTEYQIVTKQKEFIDKEVLDLEQTTEALTKLIDELSQQIESKFKEGLETINKEFAEFFQTLFSGGRAEIFLTDIPVKKEDESDPDEFELGVDISVTLPNKKIRGLSMLSGGERSLTSIALLFAMTSVTPPPFIILDETDAALDEANSKRYGDMVELLSKESQVIVITHNRETMSRAGILYGVTIGVDGVSRLLSINLDKAIQVSK